MHSALCAFSRPVCLARPQRLSVSAWTEHIPFAMNLMAVLRPRVFVELGTHHGDSYCASCQAVAELALPTRCYAVDTWEGDEHSGRYGPEVLLDLRAHHDRRYAGFSTLVQSTFEEARAHFGDGEVDLLHIDGLHTFEAARADLDAWLPKMSDSGVVLMHDINVRQRDFGVWRVWGEVAARWPHFAFAHGHGLGVAAIGAVVPPALRPLLDASEEERIEIRTFYAELGWRVGLMSEAKALADALSAARASCAESTARAASEAARAASEAARATLAEARATEAQARATATALERDAVAAELSSVGASLASSRVWRLARRWWTVRDGVLERLRGGR